MIRAFLANLGFVLIILVAFFALLIYTVPSKSAECLGQIVTASWYGPESCISHPCRTASGSAFTGRDLTAAMPSRSHLGERWRVTYRGRSVVVLVDDIGPAARLRRGIDLSRAAAERIGLVGPGVGRVCLERVG